MMSYDVPRIDPAIKLCNEARNALPILEKIRARLKDQDERDAMFEAIYNTEKTHRYYAEIVARLCAPWFEVQS